MSRPDPSDRLFPRTRRVTRRLWSPGGISGHQGVDRILFSVVTLFVVGWSAAIVRTVNGSDVLLAAGTLTANPFSPEAPPGTAFLMDELVMHLAESADVRGESRQVDVLIAHPSELLRINIPPSSLGRGVELEYRPVHNGHVELLAPGGGIPESAPLVVDSTGLISAPGKPGVWAIVAKREGMAREVPGIRVITQVPLALREGGKIGDFVVGEWPYEDGKPPSEAYTPPSGLVEVTPENVTLQLSEHFILGDFLTKGQVDVWPKYVVLSPRLLDKLELTLQEMGTRGHPVDHVGIISGFRTPTYNAHGGDTEGRASLSRHMYGDAMDFYIDNDRDGRMDDLNGDGQVNRADAQILADAAAAVEQAHPTLVGGVGVYAPTGAHAGFVHVDTRGFKARW